MYAWLRNDGNNRETTEESAGFLKIKIILGVKKVDKRKLDDVRGEVRLKGSFKKKLVSNRLKWAGHVERMGDEN